MRRTCGLDLHMHVGDFLGLYLFLKETDVVVLSNTGSSKEL